MRPENAVTRGVMSLSETLGIAERQSVPETSATRFETMLSTASLSSARRMACSSTSAPIR
jgi:hypothetical protein